MPSIEEEPPVPENSIERFYNDLDQNLLNPVDVSIALEKLLVGAGVEIDQYRSTKIIDTILDIQNQYPTDQERTEQYRFLPLSIVGAYIELTKPASEVTDWYRHVSKGMMQVYGGNHTKNCTFERSLNGSMSCALSGHCPIKHLAATLISDIEDVDFESLPYQLNRIQAFNVAMGKFNIADTLGLLGDTPEYNKLIRDKYIYQFGQNSGSIAVRRKE